MSYLIYLLLACFCILGVHTYLLVTQRNARQWSISLHAAKHNRTHAIYVLAHFLGGIFFVLFAYNFYVMLYRLDWLFYVSCAGVGFEYLQALLPARGKTDIPHTIAAYIMWVLFLIVGVFSALLIPISSTSKMVVAPLLLVSLGMFVYVHFNYSKLYFYQMWMQVLVFSSLVIIALQ